MGFLSCHVSCIEMEQCQFEFPYKCVVNYVASCKERCGNMLCFTCCHHAYLCFTAGCSESPSVCVCCIRLLQVHFIE